jgi:hypothetical protein
MATRLTPVFPVLAVRSALDGRAFQLVPENKMAPSESLFGDRPVRPELAEFLEHDLIGEKAACKASGMRPSTEKT